MPTLLHIDSSPMGDDSISRRLTREFVENWRAANPRGKVIARDLSAIQIPAIDAAWVSANMTPRELRTPQQVQALALSSEFTREVLDAGEYVIGVPMHNWGPSSSLKLWVDQIVRFGDTVAVTPSGVKGTLAGKHATFIIVAGRHYDRQSPEAPLVRLEDWLRTFFGSLGVEKMQSVLVDGAGEVKYGKRDRADFLKPHLETIHSLFAGMAV